MKLLKKHIIQWDVINWSEAIKCWEKGLNDVSNKPNALELGAGKGGISLWLAMKGCNVICSDLYNPEDNAEKLHNKYHDKKNISYQAIDVLNIPYNNYFDIIVFKSLLGGVGRNNNRKKQFLAVEQIYKALKPGGVLFYAENMVGSGMHKFFRKKFVRWGNEWRYLHLNDIDELFDHFSENNYCTRGYLGAFGRREWQRNILGWFDRFFFNNIIPQSKRYIVFGIAKK